MTLTDPTAAQTRGDSHDLSGGGGPNSYDAQVTSDSQGNRGVVGPTPRGAQSLSVSHRAGGAAGSELVRPVQEHDARHTVAGGTDALTSPGPSTSGPSAMCSAAAPGTPPAAPMSPLSARRSAVLLADPFLALAADIVDDLERVRIANENRLRQLTRTATDSDGEERGFGLDETHPDVARLAALVEQLTSAEHQATLNLARQMRRHPLGAWVKATAGVGEKQAARLIASIGDPTINTAEQRPRTVRELYSYCGYGDAAAQVRRRGERAGWNATAKMRAHLVAVSCIKVAASPYRGVYEQARAEYADTVHSEPCRRCGPSGNPAAEGTPRSAGHQHAMALRRVAKAILRDLWREATHLHDAADEGAPIS